MNVETQTPHAATTLDESEVERGDFARGGALAAENPARLVVATYNIRYAVGSHLIGGSLLRRVGLGWPSRRPRLVGRNVERAARLLSGGSSMPRADVVALQEADRGTIRAGGRHVARELAAALGVEYARAHVATPADVEPKDRKWWLDFEERMRVGESGDTGVAILSRVPLSDVERIALPWKECAWRPRLGLAATVPFGDTTLRVFNVHIDTHASVAGQLEQHDAVLGLANSSVKPAVVLGDFNTLSPAAREAARCALEANGFTTPMPTGTGTWRTGLYRQHYDWIFARGPGLRVTRWGVARVRGISDHWPVWVELEFDGGDERPRRSGSGNPPEVIWTS
ncbi:MAG TPA: endonuclease/exonuclease/phosphatase family protein [Pyrinomonadaceae bacterium]|nr:endonuclease/exonuclease/phosphatase family protein [Pyrinomonadaceae bacterium]